MTRSTGLYIVLALAAIADVGTRALVPVSVVDLSPLVAGVGYGFGFVALKAAVLMAIVAQVETIRRIPSLASTAPFLPVLVAPAWTFGALTNAAWIATH
jgi:hypothetical protein